MKISNIYLLLTPDAFTGLLISGMGFLMVYIFNKAMEAFKTLSELKLSGGLVQKDIIQVQRDIEDNKINTQKNKQCIEDLEKKMVEFEHLLNRRNNGNN